MSLSSCVRLVALMFGTCFLCASLSAADDEPKPIPGIGPAGKITKLHTGLYSTDPSFGAPKPLPQGKTGVYYVAADGKVTRLIDDLTQPNGVILSPDEKTLYVIPTGPAEMMSYPVEGPGKIGKGKVFCKLQGKDGKPGGG